MNLNGGNMKRCLKRINFLCMEDLCCVFYYYSCQASNFAHSATLAQEIAVVHQHSGRVKSTCVHLIRWRIFQIHMPSRHFALFDIQATE
ncbi:unnamed protein product [Dicrocoelium dendriticum]|nr:unnamed protein product [Dicrocoelium dendriticum]